jgi:hypothetical protein
MKIVFSISNRVLCLVGKCMSISIPASSGRGGCLNNPSAACQMTPFEGPLPIGEYYIVPSEISDPSFIKDLARNTQGDWGDWRVRLHPKPMTNTFGRDNFFLHGGGLEGSAGCIDIGGGILGNSNTDRILNMISSSRNHILVQVIK